MHNLTFLFFFLGLIFGSFINVVIYRLPKNLSIIKPRSFCPQCKQPIPFYRNIPIITYILQFGKCHNCKNKISIIYPIIEIVIGIIFLFSFSYFNNINTSISYAIISSILLSIAIIDYRYYIIPLQLIIISFLYLSIDLIILKEFTNHLSGMIFGVSYLLIILIITWFITKRQGLGYGDIQLILIIGLWYGDLRVFLVIFTAALFGLLCWTIISLYKGFDKNRMLPFGTFLSISSIIIYPLKLNLVN